MKWHKSPDAVVQAFNHCLPVVAGVERKALFGYPCASVNGHVFCGLHQDGIIVHLPEARRDALVAEGAAVFEPMPGQAMKEFVVVPTEIVQDRQRLRALLGEALAHASSLAPKAKRASAVKKTATPPMRPSAPARKAATAKKALTKKPEKEALAKKAATAGKAPAKKPEKKAPAKKKATAKKAPPKKKATAKKVPAKKKVPPERTRTKRKAPVKRAPARNSAKKAVAKKSAAGRASPKTKRSG